MKKSISPTFILICILLMISFIVVQFNVFSWNEESVTYETTEKSDWGKLDDIHAASGMYKILHTDLEVVNFVDKKVPARRLKQFYSRRAFKGAPPIIPHPIDEKGSLTGETCLSCHEHGGYAPVYNAFTPVTPHPEKRNCRQCHNPENSGKLFKNTNWSKSLKGMLGHAHLPGAPPVIPHQIQMRENCLSCHSGPAAVVEIRTTHPERVNCMQCHVEVNRNKAWVRR